MERGRTLCGVALVGWYLMVPDGDGKTWRHIDSFDTAAECREGSNEKFQWAYQRWEQLEKAIASRRAAGHQIAETDIQLIALERAKRTVQGLMDARCEVRP